MMKKECLVKTLTLGVIVLFICVSCSSAVSVDTKTSVINNQSAENKSYVDPNIHLDKSNLPMLKRSFNYFKNSNQYDIEIGKVMEQILKLIEFKGEINSEDVENILINSGIISLKIHANCKIEGYALSGGAFTIPLLFLNVLTIILLNSIFIGIGGFLFWESHSPYFGEPDINITVGSTIYDIRHMGFAFGFYGWGYTAIPVIQYYSACLYIVSGYALIVFVRPRLI